MGKSGSVPSEHVKPEKWSRVTLLQRQRSRACRLKPRLPGFPYLGLSNLIVLVMFSLPESLLILLILPMAWKAHLSGPPDCIWPLGTPGRKSEARVSILLAPSLLGCYGWLVFLPLQEASGFPAVAKS